MATSGSQMASDLRRKSACAGTLNGAHCSSSVWAGESRKRGAAAAAAAPSAPSAAMPWSSGGAMAVPRRVQPTRKQRIGIVAFCASPLVDDHVTPVAWYRSCDARQEARHAACACSWCGTRPGQQGHHRQQRRPHGEGARRAPGGLVLPVSMEGACRTGARGKHARVSHTHPLNTVARPIRWDGHVGDSPTRVPSD